MSTRTGAATTFWNVIAKFYAKQKISDQDAYEAKLAATQKYFTPESRVLEFGCGTGSTALIHAKHVSNILAIDSSKNMIAIANEKKETEQIGNVEFREATIFDLEDEPNSFDAILALNVLHLIPQMQETITKTYELLKPGGVFVTSTACAAQMPWSLKLLISAGGNIGVLPKLLFFTSEELDDSMKRAGFDILASSAPGQDKNIRFVIAKK